MAGGRVNGEGYRKKNAEAYLMVLQWLGEWYTAGQVSAMVRERFGERWPEKTLACLVDAEPAASEIWRLREGHQKSIKRRCRLANREERVRELGEMMGQIERSNLTLKEKIRLRLTVNREIRDEMGEGGGVKMFGGTYQDNRAVNVTMGGVPPQVADAMGARMKQLECEERMVIDGPGGKVGEAVVVPQKEAENVG